MTTVADAPVEQHAAAVAPRPLLAAGGLCWREVLRFLRQPNRVFGAVAQPVMFWLLFGIGFAPSFQPPGISRQVSYAEYFFPGIVVLVVLFTAIFTTISVIEDRREGFLQAVLVAPVPRWSLVLGKLAGGALIALFEGSLLLILGAFFTVHVSALGLLLALPLLACVALALTGLGFVFAWLTDSTQGFHAVMSVLLFPMWLLSGAFFPAESTWLAWIARLNPLTYGVAGLRRLLYAGVADAPLVAGTPGFGACLTITLLFALTAFLATWLVTTRPGRADL